MKAEIVANEVVPRKLIKRYDRTCHIRQNKAQFLIVYFASCQSCVSVPTEITHVLNEIPIAVFEITSARGVPGSLNIGHLITHCVNYAAHHNISFPAYKGLQLMALPTAP